MIFLYWPIPMTPMTDPGAPTFEGWSFPPTADPLPFFPGSVPAWPVDPWIGPPPVFL